MTFDEEYYAPESIAQKGITTATREEYAPRAAQTAFPFTAIKLLDASGRLQLLSQQLTTARQEFRVQTPEPTRAELATLAYPGWTARIDGSEIPNAVVPQRGTMSIDVPAGEHTVTLTLEPTPVRRWSAWFSVLALFCTIAAICMSAVQAYINAAEQPAQASEPFRERTRATGRPN